MMHMVETLERQSDWYQERFGEFEKTLNGSSETRLHDLRRRALTRFVALGFPTTKDEEWRFTNLAPLARIRFAPVLHQDPSGAETEQIQHPGFNDFRCIRLLFVDGHFVKEASAVHSLLPGVVIGGLRSAIDTKHDLVFRFLARHVGLDGDALAALNTAFLQDGAFVHVPDGVSVELPVHLLFVSTKRDEPFLSTPRNLIVAGAGSRVSIVETYAGPENEVYFTNAVTEIVLGEGAVVEHDKLQIESMKAFHVGAIHVRQSAKSIYTANSISLGGSLVRNTVGAVLDGEYGECTLNGLSLATGSQIVDNHTTIDHAKPNCVSHELYKSILDGASRGVFNGKIYVRKDAQKTDAKQTNKTLLLSDDATIDTKPQLEIFADDVKCTHGATVGQLDEEQVFYLRSRGIGFEQARDVLTFAFAGDVIQRVHIDPLRDQIEGMINSRLRRGRVEA